MEKLRKLTSVLGSLFQNKTQKALKTLDLSEKEVVKIASLRTRRQEVEFALQTLNISYDDLRNINKIKKEGEKKYALNTLNVSEKVFTEYLEYSTKSTRDKILSLVNDKVGIRDFFNKTYANFDSFKRVSKGAWKKESYEVHLLKMKTILDNCLQFKTISLKQAKDLAMLAYMSAYCCHYSKHKPMALAA